MLDRLEAYIHSLTGPQCLGLAVGAIIAGTLLLIACGVIYLLVRWGIEAVKERAFDGRWKRE